MAPPLGPRPVLNDFTGQKVPGTRWTVTTRNLDQTVRGVFWNCVCDCGNTAVVITGNLKSGASKSCGCYSAERTSEVKKTHGKSRTAIYTVWSNIKERCRNPNNAQYKDYGGRGITLCDRWADSFAYFLADVGEQPTPEHSIDRIDNDGNYEPGNVRWATRLQQANNRRKKNHLITFGGETKSINAWAKHFGVGSGGLYYRIVNKGMSLEDAVKYLTTSL